MSEASGASRAVGIDRIRAVRRTARAGRSPARIFPLLLVLTACRGGDGGSGDPAPEPIPQVEVDRGQSACRDLAERTCRCAAGKPELAADCQDARALPEALKMNIEAAGAGGVDRRVQLRLQFEARRTMARCFEEINRLTTLGCP